MKKHLVLVKIGGGFITDKAKPMAANVEAIDDISQQISKVSKANSHVDFILANGVGSFGHFTAHEYALREGAKNKQAVYGAARTHVNAQKINLLLAEAFMRRSLSTFTFSPASLLLSTHDEICFFVEPLQQGLESGFTPLLHGDTVIDNRQGVKIFSTEKVLHECLKRLRGKYEKIQVVYFVNTRGIYDVDGNTIKELLPSQPVAIDTAHEHDVTGGVEGRVESARLAAELADDVFIVDGRSASELQNIILGNGCKSGTRIASK